MRSLNTQKEFLDFDKIQIYRLSKLAGQDMGLLEEVSHHLPFYVTLNQRENLDTTFESRVIDQLLNLDNDSFVKFGYEKIKSISDPEVLKRVMREINNFNKYGGENDMCTYLQRIKFYKSYDWLSTHKTIFNEYLYFNVGYPLEKMGKPGRVLLDILDDVLIDKNAWDKFDSLSQREKEVLKLIARGYNSRELSEVLFVSEHTVKTHRKNISYKLGIKSSSEWVKFAQAFEMI